MGFLKSLFGAKSDNKKAESVAPEVFTAQDFWDWFISKEQQFFNVVKNHDDVEKNFFDVLKPALDKYSEKIFYLTGMYKDDVAELILTAEGSIKKIAFIEQLIEAAPKLDNWRFTAHKPAHDFLGVEMHGYKFDERMVFYAAEHSVTPDYVHIRVAHPDMGENNIAEITQGVFIAMDNYLGDVYFATAVDKLEVVPSADLGGEAVPIKKLKSYLNYREKEFIEKYDDVRRDTSEDKFGAYEWQNQEGAPFVAVMNQSALNWDSKMSHPWMMTIDIEYDGSQNNGMPSADAQETMQMTEDAIEGQLQDSKGYVNIGRITGGSERTIYIACVEYKNCSLIVDSILKSHQGGLKMEYSIHRDKYWSCLSNFISD